MNPTACLYCHASKEDCLKHGKCCGNCNHITDSIPAWQVLKNEMTTWGPKRVWTDLDKLIDKVIQEAEDAQSQVKVSNIAIENMGKEIDVLRAAAKRVLDSIGPIPTAEYFSALTQLEGALKGKLTTFECPDCGHQAQPCGGGFVNRDNPPEVE